MNVAMAMVCSQAPPLRGRFGSMLCATLRPVRRANPLPPESGG